MRKRPRRHIRRRHRRLNKTNVRRAVVNPKVTHKEFVYGDFDRDTVPNIDDKMPFNPKESSQVDELRLSDELKELEDYRETFTPILEDFAKENNVSLYRVKTPISTINKLRRKHLASIQDIAGAVIIVKNRREMLKKSGELKKKYKVIADEDYYEINKNTKSPYFAHHLTLLYKGKPIEIQIKTPEQHKLHIKMHKAYKQEGRLSPSFRQVAEKIREQDI